MTATPDQFANFAQTVTAGGGTGTGGALQPTDTSFTVTTGTGSLFPSGSPFMLLLGSATGTYELVKCTNRTTDTLTIVRGSNLPAPDTNTARSWAVGTSVQQAATAGNLTNVWNALNAGRVYFPYDYGTIGGATDDVAINAAIAACAANGGGVVQLEAMTHKTSASIVQNADNVILRGYGWHSVIQPQSGAQYDAISTPIPSVVGTSGYVRNYLGIYDLAIDCSLMTGTTAGQGNGIHWYGVRYSRIRNVSITSCPNWAILLDGDNTAPGQNFGYDNYVEDCVYDLCAGGCYQTNCEANQFLHNQFKWAGAACAAAQPVFGSTDTTAMHLRLGAGYATVMGNVLGKGGTYTTEAIRCTNSGPCRIIGNRFDQVRYQAVTLNGGNHLFAFNALGTPSSYGTTNAIQIGSSNNIVIGNQFDSTAGAYHHTWAVAESGGPFTGNIIMGNHLPAGSSGSILTTAGSTHVEWGNTGVHNEQFKGDAIPAVATTTYQILDTDNLVYVDSTTAAFTVTLPNARNGLVVTLKDKTGHCATNNVTVNTLSSATIDGAASGSVKITTNYGVLRVVSDGTNWFTI